MIGVTVLKTEVYNYHNYVTGYPDKPIKWQFLYILYLIRDQKAPLSLQDEDQPAQEVPLQVSS